VVDGACFGGVEVYHVADVLFEVPLLISLGGDDCGAGVYVEEVWLRHCTKLI